MVPLVRGEGAHLVSEPFTALTQPSVLKNHAPATAGASSAKRLFSLLLTPDEQGEPLSGKKKWRARIGLRSLRTIENLTVRDCSQAFRTESFPACPLSSARVTHTSAGPSGSSREIAFAIVMPGEEDSRNRGLSCSRRHLRFIRKDRDHRKLCPCSSARTASSNRAVRTLPNRTHPNAG